MGNLRKSSDRKLCGVCGGLARYWDVDPTIVRVAWAFTVLCGAPFAVLAYVLLAMLMPD